MNSETSKPPLSPSDEIIAFIRRCLTLWITITQNVTEVMAALAKGSASAKSARITLSALDSASRTIRNMQEIRFKTFLILANKPLPRLIMKACHALADKIIPKANSDSVSFLQNSSSTTPSHSSHSSHKSHSSHQSHPSLSPTPSASPRPKRRSPLSSDSLQATARRILSRCASQRRRLERFAARHGLGVITPDPSSEPDVSSVSTTDESSSLGSFAVPSSPVLPPSASIRTSISGNSSPCNDARHSDPAAIYSLNTLDPMASSSPSACSLSPKPRYSYLRSLFNPTADTPSNPPTLVDQLLSRAASRAAPS